MRCDFMLHMNRMHGFLPRTECGQGNGRIAPKSDCDQIILQPPERRIGKTCRREGGESEIMSRLSAAIYRAVALGGDD